MGLESQPSLPITPIAVAGLNAGDSLVAIDVRPQNGRLYGLATTSAAGAVRLYSIDISSTTPYATAIGAAGSFVDVGNSPITDLGTNFGIDFKPALDRLRVVSDNGSTFRINPNTGALVDGNLGGAVVTGTNSDGPISGATIWSMPPHIPTIHRIRAQQPSIRSTQPATRSSSRICPISAPKQRHWRSPSTAPRSISAAVAASIFRPV